MIYLSKSGLEFLGEKPYEAAMLRIIWRDGRVCTRGIFNELEGTENEMDRITFIVSLKKHVAAGELVGEPEDESKRSRVWYSPHPDCSNEKAFIEKRLKYLFRRLRDEFPEHYHLSNLQ